MCGIAGYITKRPTQYETASPIRIKKMCDCMKDRGPDDSGIWMNEDGRVVLGHRRLSILDLSQKGRQPMISASGDWIISYNGEIYNYKEIQELLWKEGAITAFRSQCDTEILLEAFSWWGIEKTLEKIRGMFAIALYDKSRHLLYLIRDRMGEKPLFYGKIGEDFAFASSLDAVAACSGETLELDRSALLQYLCYGCVPAPMTIYKNVKKLLPGEMITINAKDGIQMKQTIYWDIRKTALQKRISGQHEQEATEYFEELLTAVVKEQLTADVPVGAYLSGGVDSSLIAAVMRNISPGFVRTYTIGIEGDASDESAWAQKVADCLGVKHRTEYISKDNMMEAVLQMGEIFGEPFADVSMVPTYLVSRLAKTEVTVTLSGDGGDELFCGYRHYKEYSHIWTNRLASPKYGRFPRLIGQGICRLPYNRFTDRAYEFTRKCSADSLEELYRCIAWSGQFVESIVKGRNSSDMETDPTPLQQYKNPGLGDYENLMLADQLQYLPDDILEKVDRTGMACSLENRIPLLDKKIVEFAWSLPIAYKYSENVSKRIMRHVLYKYVPPSLIERPKQGFSFPVLGWIKSNTKAYEWAQSLFYQFLSKESQMLNEQIVQRLWNDYIENRKSGHVIWNLLMLFAWAEKRNRTL